jgi:hypothetical protein
LEGLAIEDVGILKGNHFVYFTIKRNILWTFGTFFPILVCRTEKTLATLFRKHEASLCFFFVSARVTRLGKLSPIGRLITLCSFFEKFKGSA